MTVTELEYEQANSRMQRSQHGGTVVSARYQRAPKRLVIELTTGVQLSVPATRLEGLSDATARQLDQIEISPSGLGLHWPLLDVDLYVPGLLQGVLGSKKWMASLLGRKGGASTSKAKQAAARTNGRLGGRPKGTPGIPVVGQNSGKASRQPPNKPPRKRATG